MEFTWRVIYDNKETFGQRDGRYEDIDRKRVKFFDLLDQRGGVVHRLRVDTLWDKVERFFYKLFKSVPSKKMWFWRRRTVMKGVDLLEVIHLVGWKKGAKCRMVFVFADGGKYVTRTWDNPCPYDPPQLHEQEEAT